MGARKIALPVLAPSSDPLDTTPMLVKLLAQGDQLTFHTPDAQRLPLPHPALFQLHAICARVLAAKAAAGYSHLNRFADHEGVGYMLGEDGDESESESESESDGEEEDAENIIHDVVGWLRRNSVTKSEDVLTASENSELHPGANNIRPPVTIPYESADDNEANGDKSRYVDLVREEFGGRMGDMWRKARARLGREPHGGQWWEAGNGRIV